MSNERTTAGKTASGRACARRDWGENGITEERARAAAEKLLASAVALETNAERYAKSEAARAVLRRFDGKKVTRRLFDALAVAWGAERIEHTWGGGHSFRGLEWKGDETWEHVAAVEIESAASWRQTLDIKGDGGELDAAATVAAWDACAAQWVAWARGDRAAAGCIDWAAKEYNELHARARQFLGELEKRLEGAVINPEIKVLCAFGGDVYDRVNPFRWHESKCWEDERRG